MLKKCISIFLALLCVLSLVACSAQGQSEQQKSNSPVQKAELTGSGEKIDPAKYGVGAVYDKEAVTLPTPTVRIHSFVRTGDQIALYGEDEAHRPVFYRYDPASKAVTQLDIAEKLSVEAIGASRDGSLPIVALAEDGSYEMLIYDGNTLPRRFLLPTIEAYQDDMITDFAKTDKGFIVLTHSEVIALDNDGNFLRSLSPYHRTASCIISNNDDSIILAVNVAPAPGASRSSTKVIVLDQDFTETASYKSDSDFSGFYGALDIEDAILARAGNTVFLFNYVKDTQEPLIDAFSSGMHGDLIQLEKECYFSAEMFLPCEWHTADNTETGTLTLATYGLNYELQDLIQRYNDSHSGKKIIVKDYSTYDDAEGNSGLTRLQTEIIAGFTPDIYDLSSLPAELYARKGLLEELSPYFSEGAEYSLSDFVPNVVDALKMNGGLYCLTPTFSVMAITGNKELVGDRDRWTPTEFFEMIADTEPGRLFGPTMTRDKLLAYTVMFNCQDYIDRNTLECHFTDSDFAQFLRLAAQLPAEEKTGSASGYASLYTGNQLFLFDWYSSLALDQISYADAVFPNGAAFIGFPASSSSGLAIVPSALVGISSVSHNKELALNFLMYILNSGNNKSVDLPIVKASLDKKLAAKADLYEEYVAADIHYLGTSYDGAPITINGTMPVDKALSLIYDLIGRADTLAIFDDTLFQIIMRESEAYFAGGASLEQAVKGIQSKAEIYLSEQYG